MGINFLFQINLRLCQFTRSLHSKKVFCFLFLFQISDVIEMAIIHKMI
jgi:hypothetical protein